MPDRLLGQRIGNRQHQSAAALVGYHRPRWVLDVDDGLGDRELADLPALLVAEENFELLLEVAKRVADQSAFGRLGDEVEPEALLGPFPVLRAGQGNRREKDLLIAVHVLLDDADLVGAALVRLHADQHRDVAVGTVKSLEADALDLTLGVGPENGGRQEGEKEENPRQETTHRPRNVRPERPWDKSKVGRSL